jgi:predicted membrane metal-binding protein
MFEVNYRNTIKDMIWFNIYSFRKFPLNIFLIIPAIFIILSNLLLPKEDMALFIILEIIGIYIIITPIMILGLIVFVYLSYKSGKGKNVICDHRLTFTDENFIEKTENNENKYNWNAVVKFNQTKKYNLIYVSGISAHIIPKVYLSNEENEKLADIVLSKIK